MTTGRAAGWVVSSPIVLSNGCRRALSKAGSSLVLVLGLLSEGWAQVSRIPHDPALLAKIRTGNYSAIQNDSTSALGVAAIIRAFQDSGCRGQVPGGSVAEVIRLTQRLTQDIGGSLLLIEVHPNYLQAGSLVGASGCDSKAVQGAMFNVIAYLRQRYEPARPGGGKDNSDAAAARRGALASLPLKRSHAGNYADMPIGEEYTSVKGMYDFRKQSNAKVLLCVYGDMRMYFWRERIWHSHKELTKMHPEHPLLNVPEKVVDACPPTAGAAFGVAGLRYR